MQLSIKQVVTDVILGYINKNKLADRAFAKKVGISHTLVGKFRTESAMNMDTLDKIVDNIPEIKEEISRVFVGFYKEKDSGKKSDTESDKAERLEHLADLREDIKHLRRVNSEQSQAILNFSRWEIKMSNPAQ